MQVVVGWGQEAEADVLANKGRKAKAIPAGEKAV